MSWYHKMERRLEPFVPANLTLYLVIGQTFVLLTQLLGLLDPTRIMLLPVLALDGEWWRVVTYIFQPPTSHWLFVAFALYFLYFTGNALEEYWGPARYALFLLVGYVLTTAAAFVTPNMVATNLFIGGSLFLAFAYLNPNFTMYVFMVLPLKIKWLALLSCVYFAYAFFTGGIGTKLSIAAALGNFFIFLGKEMLSDVVAGKRRLSAQSQRAATQRRGPEARHRCYVCGKTDLTDPQLDFRYCSKCVGDQCYCPEHLRTHQHVLFDPDAKS